MVSVVVESGDAYLIQVVKKGEAALGRYFIIPKTHHVALLQRPREWTEWENELLRAAFMIAESDEVLMKTMAGRPLSEALNLNWNQGWSAGQRVKHIHLWVCFRYDDLEIGLDGLIELALGQRRELLAADKLLAKAGTRADAFDA